MAKYILFCFLLSLSLFSFAHQPDLSSTMLSRLDDGRWILQVRSSLTAFESEIHTKHGTDSYATPEEFQLLALEHVRDNVDIDFGLDARAILKNGQVRLGHETNVIFEVEGVPEEICLLTVTNSTFKHIHGNQNAFVILKEGLKTQQFILKDKNQHTASMKVVGNYLQLQGQKS